MELEREWGINQLWLRHLASQKEKSSQEPQTLVFQNNTVSQNKPTSLKHLSE